MGLAERPPMGWNSWNCFLGDDFRAQIDRITADAIVGCAQALVDSGMRAAGYEYVVLDDGWQDHRRDPQGRLVAHPQRFPDGIAAVAERVHALGLKFGLYTVPGSLTCAQQWDDYGGEPLGSLGHEEIDAQTFAEWGVDFLKYDWCAADTNDGLTAVDTFTRMRRVLDQQSRSVVYAISEYGTFEPWFWAPGVAHMWRTTGDLVPTWESLMRTLDLQAPLAAYSRPGAWNDPDMLQVGNGQLTDGENRAHLYLWAVLNAPLMAGNDLRRMTPAVRDLLCDPEVIAINQDWGGRQGTRIGPAGPAEVWAKPMSDGGATVVLLNRSDEPRDISATALERRMSRRVPPHDAALVRLRP